MRLTESEYYQYIKLHQRLILYAGQTHGLLDKALSFDEFQGLSSQEKFIPRQALYDHPNTILTFVKENPYDFSDQELAMVEGFRHFVRGDFVVYKYLKNYTIFLQDDIAYGVLALSDTFQSFFGDNLPTMIKAVLLPFNGKIVYDGMFQSYPVYFGGGIKRSMNEDYKFAKAQYGIVTQLPFDGKPAYEQQAPEEQLDYFMKNKANREQFEADIDELLERKPSLLPAYYQKWGKIHSAVFKKKLKSLGIETGHFAILEDTLIGGAPEKEDVEEIIKALVPKKKQDWVYVFKL